MFSEADIPRTDALDALVVERLGRHAVNALGALWAGAGFFEDNRRHDHHGFGVSRPDGAAVQAGVAGAGELDSQPADPPLSDDRRSEALAGVEEAAAPHPDEAAPAPVEAAAGQPGKAGEIAPIADDPSQVGQATDPQVEPADKDIEDRPTFSLTTVCCLEALVDAAALRPRWMPKEMRKRLVSTMLPALLELDPSGADPIHPQDDHNPRQLELLRAAALVNALDKTNTWRPRRDDLDEDERSALEKLQSSVSARLEPLAVALIDSARKLPHDQARTLHPYVAYVISSALQRLSDRSDLARVDVNQAQDALLAVWEPSRENLERLLARHSIGLVNANEAVAVALYAGVAAAVGPSALRYIQGALDAAVDERFAIGGWHQGRVVSQQRQGDHATVTLTVPTFEVARALGEVIARSLDDPLEDAERLPSASRVIDGLASAVRSAEASRVEAPGESGWPGEQIIEGLLVESWPTASVLALCVAASEVIDAAERRQRLRELSAFPSWGEDWPDYLDWADYVGANEPEEDAKILEFIDDEVVKPRQNRRPGASTDATVVLLFGPPGTTKTTIARAVASGLRWPIVQLTPGNFIEEGLEKIEQRAEFYFTRLQALYRTVVIMDECDELFRRRKPDDVSDAVRQVSAFMTASMLPKLQDLHDRSRIVLFICTNFLTSIDPAIKRVGRVDHLVAVAPPDEAQRRHTIALEAGKRADAQQQDWLNLAISTLARETEHFIRGELVAAGRELKAVISFTDAEDAGRVAREIASRMKPAMTINLEDQVVKKEFDQFERDGKAISQPHRNAKARQAS